MTTKLLAAVNAAVLLCAAGEASAADSIATADIARVQGIYGEAQKMGAAAAAPEAMQSAQVHLQSAQDAANHGKNEFAARLAEEAEVDADLAIARARERAAEDSARQVEASLTALRETVNHEPETAAPAVGPMPMPPPGSSAEMGVPPGDTMR